MEIKGITLPKIDKSCIQNKAKQVWSKLNEDNIEINVKPSVAGIILFTIGVGLAVGISECISQMEIKKALRKQKKEFEKEKAAEIEALIAEVEANSADWT